jgi:hypothetical protein
MHIGGLRFAVEIRDLGKARREAELSGQARARVRPTCCSWSTRADRADWPCNKQLLSA